MGMKCLCDNKMYYVTKHEEFFFVKQTIVGFYTNCWHLLDHFIAAFVHGRNIFLGTILVLIEFSFRSTYYLAVF